MLKEPLLKSTAASFLQPLLQNPSLFSNIEHTAAFLQAESTCKVNCTKVLIEIFPSRSGHNRPRGRKEPNGNQIQWILLKNIMRTRKATDLDRVEACGHSSILHFYVGGRVSKFAFILGSGALAALELATNFQRQPS